MKCHLISVRKDGKKREKQAYRCTSCNYRWTIKGNHQINYQNYYHQWLFSRKTLAEVSFDLGIFYPKLIKEFDRIDVDEGLQEEITQLCQSTF